MPEEEEEEMVVMISANANHGSRPGGTFETGFIGNYETKAVWKSLEEYRWHKTLDISERIVCERQ